MSKYIHLTAVIKSKPEYLKEVKHLLENMVKYSTKEVACLKYDLHQGIEDENLFVFNEIWQNQDGLASHNEQPYIKEFKKSVPSKLQEEPQIYITTKI